MDIVDRLDQRLVMSMFVDTRDLYREQEKQRKEAAATIRQLRAELARMKQERDYEC